MGLFASKKRRVAAACCATVCLWFLGYERYEHEDYDSVPYAGPALRKPSEIGAAPAHATTLPRHPAGALHPPAACKTCAPVHPTEMMCQVSPQLDIPGHDIRETTIVEVPNGMQVKRAILFGVSPTAQQCCEACAADEQCVVASLGGNQCFLKTRPDANAKWNKLDTFPSRHHPGTDVIYAIPEVLPGEWKLSFEPVPHRQIPSLIAYPFVDQGVGVGMGVGTDAPGAGRSGVPSAASGEQGLGTHTGDGAQSSPALTLRWAKDYSCAFAFDDELSVLGLGDDSCAGVEWARYPSLPDLWAATLNLNDDAAPEEQPSSSILCNRYAQQAAKSATQQFDVIVLNRETRSDRRKHMESQLTNVNWPGQSTVVEATGEMGLAGVLRPPTYDHASMPAAIGESEFNVLSMRVLSPMDQVPTCIYLPCCSVG